MSWLFPPAPYRLLITILFVALIIALSIAPGRAEPDDSVFVWLLLKTGKPVQKMLHVGVYAALAFLWMWTLDDIESRATRVLLSLAITIGLGAILEWYQLAIPGRFGTLTDILLNSAGAVAGLLVALLLL